MRIGLMIGADGTRQTLDDLIKRARRARRLGINDLWLANIFSFDAVNALTVIGRAVPDLGLGTAVTPTYPRHPTALAQQALTAAAATDNRFVLGIGLSHKGVIEDMLGFSYERPARHMREYLDIIGPLLRGEGVQVSGAQLTARGVQFDVPGARPVPLVIGGLGPVMLRLAGERADGTNTWMVGQKTMGEHIVPRLRKAAEAAGRDAPAVVAGFPIVLTKAVAEAREHIAKTLTIYGQLPSYRAMLDREGVAGPADIALVGDETVLRKGLKALKAQGVTHFNAAIADTDRGAFKRTLAFLGDYAPKRPAKTVFERVRAA
ncbi:MAG: TIGR03564 family F420-dependent LLM class oxidoreductase [Pseudomonadota bacterium]